MQWLGYILVFVVGVSMAHAEEAVELADDLREDVPFTSLPRRFEMTPQVSVVSITALNIPIPGYSVNYVPAIEGLPTFQLMLGRPVADFGRFSLTAQAAIGYGSRSGSFLALDNGARTTQSENLTLRWIPMTLSMRFAYRSLDFAYLRPSLTLGFGNLTILQSSDNAAFSRTVGIPLLVVSPQITFMDGGSRHWLGGFSFGMTLLRGLGGDATLAASSLDLSLNLLL